MDILFTTFGRLSWRGGEFRSISMVRALADAGHRVDVVAAKVDIPEHSGIDVLARAEHKPLTRLRVRQELLQTMGRRSYDVVHAVEEVALFARKICKWKKVPLVYDARRRFTGSHSTFSSFLWKLFPRYFLRQEKKLLEQASRILTQDETLGGELGALVPEARIVQVQDVPIQSLFPISDGFKDGLLCRFGFSPSVLIACRVTVGVHNDLRMLLVSVRKVVEAIPQVAFVFMGISSDEAEAMAATLDILDHCLFLKTEELEEFLAAIGMAGAILFIPLSGDRYVHSDIFTLLNSPAPLVAVFDGAYSRLLNDANAIEVLPNAELVAEGLIRAIQEPLFSLAIATGGQQMIADHYSFSSFKHKIRMAYHELEK